MRYFFLSFAVATVLAATTADGALVYDPVVTVVGDGSGALATDTGYITSIYIYADSVASQASPVSSTAFLNGGNSPRLVTSGSATSEGSLTNNPGVADAAAKGAPYGGTQYVYSAGYDAANATADVGTSTTNAPRSFGQTNVTNNVASSATVLKTQTQTDAYRGTAGSNANVRGAVGDDTGAAKYTAGNAATATGATGGWRNFASGTSTLLDATQTNVRTVELLNGRLFGSTGSGTRGLHVIDPTGTNPATLYIDTGGTSSAYEFALFDDPRFDNGTGSPLNLGFDTAYVADDRTSTSGGIQKWTWDGTLWNLQYTLKDAGLTSPQYRGLAGQLDAATGLITLFTSVETSASGGNTRLQQITDDNGALSTFTTLATLANSSGLKFRGVALSAIPEPGALLFGALVCGVIGLGVGGRRLRNKLVGRD